MGCMVERGWLRRAGKFRPSAGLNSITIVAVQFVKNGEQRCFVFLAKIGDTGVLELQHCAQGVELGRRGGTHSIENVGEGLGREIMGVV
jgi:hypothetical protein